MLRGYKRLAFINTGKDGIENLRIRSQEIAQGLELRCEEIRVTLTGQNGWTGFGTTNSWLPHVDVRLGLRSLASRLASRTCC